MAAIARRFNYFRRIVPAYVLRRESQLSFWHDEPAVNPLMRRDRLGYYYMPFFAKAHYPGPTDEAGVPLLHYHGQVGLQYNPIAIAQWGLGNYNLWRLVRSRAHFDRFVRAAEWLAENAEPNAYGFPVWMHRFDFEYRTGLKAPWYSGLAQGQGISLLVRAAAETGEAVYLERAAEALHSLLLDTGRGGVGHEDGNGDWWIEEYLVDPPSHILNGFIWASWGPFDYWLATGDENAKELFGKTVQTIAANLHRYDTGYWSTYEFPWKPMPMLASPFYHRLHIAQLSVMARLTRLRIFNDFATKWMGYYRRPVNRAYALAHKSLFKMRYY